MEPTSSLAGSARRRREDSPALPPKGDWELWSIALILLTILAGGALTVGYLTPRPDTAVSPWALRFIWLLLFGLIALVLLLNVYLLAKRRELFHLQQLTRAQETELSEQREHAVTDAVTHVYNRRFFDEVVPKEARRAVRANRPLSFLLVDLDNFRRINSEFGHFVGDEVLRQVAEALKNSLRASDYLFRFGGDEFLLVLPETDDGGTATVAVRLRQTLAAHQGLHQRLGRPLTVTIGAAVFLAGRTLESVIEEAEAKVATARIEAAQPELKTTGLI